MEYSKGVPQCENWMTLHLATKTSISARAFVEQEKLALSLHGIKGWTSRRSVYQGRWCQAEEQRSRWRSTLERCRDICVTGDGKKQWDDVGFHAIDFETLLPTRGLLGIAEYVSASPSEKLTLQEIKAKKKTDFLVKGVLAVVKEIVHEGNSGSHLWTSPGTFREDQYKHFCDSVTSMVFDQDGSTQHSARMLANQEFKNTVVTSLDQLHRLRHDLFEPATKEPLWNDFLYHLKNKKKSPVKQCTYSQRFQMKHHAAQQYVIKTNGSQGGGYRRVINDFAFNDNHQDNDIIQLGSLVVSWVVSPIASADESEDTSQPVWYQQSGAESAKRMTSVHCLLCGANVDRMKMEKRFLHDNFDKDFIDPAKTPRLVRRFIENRKAIFLDGPICSVTKMKARLRTWQ